MAVLKQSQIKAIAVTAGLPQPDLMAAIAMAESSGRTDVVNSIGATGLWQINQPVHVKAHPTWTKQWLKNPVNNARAAKVIYQQQGLQAWEAYTNGAYKKYLGDVGQGAWDDISKVLTDPVTPVLEGGKIAADATGLDPLLAIADFIAKAGNWVSNPENWIRIVYVTGGAIIVVAGISIMAKPVIMPVAKTVASVVPTGKAATALKGNAAGALKKVAA